MHKRLEEGGLNIPHWKSRIAGLHSKWISRLQTCGETLRQIFNFNNIVWGDPRSFITPFPKRSGTTFADTCLNAWLDNLKLLDLTMDSLAWPLLRGELQLKFKSQFSKATLLEAFSNQVPGLNFLKQLGARKQLQAYMNTAESTRSKDALELRAARFMDLNPLPTTAENANAWKDKISALKLKYGTKKLRYLDQRQMYWLSVDQILP
jgi:hypothetical protein